MNAYCFIHKVDMRQWHPYPSYHISKYKIQIPPDTTFSLLIQTGLCILRKTLSYRHYPNTTANTPLGPTTKHHPRSVLANPNWTDPFPYHKIPLFWVPKQGFQLLTFTKRAYPFLFDVICECSLKPVKIVECA